MAEPTTSVPGADAPVGVLNTSRLRFYSFVVVRGRTFWAPDPGMPAPPEPATDDTDYTVKRGDVADNIAFKTLRDPALWWVVGRTNGLRVLPFDLLVGSKLRVLSQRRVEQTLL
jgi:nucleoid-associated protein YgaU